MPSAKKQLKNKQNKPNLKNHDSLKKAYALKNTGDFNPNKYHDLSNIIESGDYGLDVLGNTISDQVIPGKIINLGNQLHEENPSEYGRGINMGLELTKNITPFWGDAGINALQKGVSYLSNENPKGIDRAYENYFNNEKGPKYTNGGNLNRVKSDPIRIQKNKQIQKENKDLNFVSRIEDPSLTFPDSQGNPMTHYMASADNIVFPTVVQQHGNNNLNRLGYEEAYEYANKSGEYIKFPSEKDAIDYGINYKQGTKLEEFNNGGYIKKLKYNKKGTYPTYEFPPMAFGGWLDTLPNQYPDGGSIEKPKSAKAQLAINENNPITLKEYTVKGESPAWLDDLDKEKQNYLNTQAYPGLVKGYGQTMDNFPKDREDEIKNSLKWKYNTIEAEKIFKDLKADSNDRTTWINKLDDNQKEIIKNSKYAYQLDPSIWQSTGAGLGSLYNMHPLSNLTGKIERTPGVTKQEFKDATALDALEPLNYLGTVGANVTNSLSEYGKYKNQPYFTGQHDPNRPFGSEELMNPLNWTLPGDLAALPQLANLGVKGVKNLNNAIKTSKESGVLSNAYKYNPWAFKANPESLYRGIGEAGYRDAIESGLIRPNPKGKYQDLYTSPSFEFAETYGGYGKGKQHMVELPKILEKNAKDIQFGGSEVIFDKPIPIDNAKFYKEDWLRGYKEVPKNSSNTFKSEIDWIKWDVAAKDNPDVVNHLIDIERKTKEDGSWMKNADGTPFKGDPEEFVVMQSDNYKKAFPEGHTNVYRGAGKFDPEFINNRGTFTANKDLAKKYVPGEYKDNVFTSYQDNIFTPESQYYDKGLYNLIHKNSKNSFEFNFANDKWSDLNISTKKERIKNLENYLEQRSKDVKKTKKEDPKLYNLIKGYNSKVSKSIKDDIKVLKSTKSNDSKLIEDLQKDLGTHTTTDDIASYIELKDLDYAKLNNVVDGGLGDVTIVNHKKGNYLKSLRHNIMLDMNNPNIYKALIPAAVGAGVLQQKKNGGWLDNL